MLAFCLLLVGEGRAAIGDAPIAKLAEFHTWTAFVAGAGSARVCYIASPPGIAADSARRAPAYAYVSLRPARQQQPTVMIRAGYRYAPRSEVRVEIGKRHFTLFTVDDTAWADDGATDQKLAEAMRQGKTMVIYGVPAEGKATMDMYSLTGFAAALKRIAEACGS